MLAKRSRDPIISAGQLLEEARRYIDLDSLERLRDQQDRDLYTYYQYLQGALLACTGRPEKGYSKVLDIPKARERRSRLRHPRR